MRKLRSNHLLQPAFATITIAALALTAGCRSPSGANIELRKENQALRDEIATLKTQRQGDAAQIRALEAQRGTLPTLPHERLERLFTAHGLKIGRLTGGADLDPDRPGDEAIKVYAVPTDANGDLLKAAGAFTVEAYDLSRGPDAFLGRWQFDVDASRQLWHGSGLMYGYTLTCPWLDRVPAGETVLVRVVFVDELTGRSLEAQSNVTVQPPPAPATTGAPPTVSAGQ